MNYAPDLSVHSEHPEMARLCPYCHPDRIDKAQTSATEADAAYKRLLLSYQKQAPRKSYGVMDMILADYQNLTQSKGPR